MDFNNYSNFTSWPSLPVIVFFAETCVVTLSTIRTIFIARGWKSLAALLGFFEVSIWLFAIAQVMQHLNSLGCFLAFAAGFSLGNYLGVLIEQKLALGHVAVHVVTRKNDSSVADNLRWAGFGVTALQAAGDSGPVHALFTVVSRRELGLVTSIIRRQDPQAYFSVGDLRSIVDEVDNRRLRLSGIIPSIFLGTSRNPLTFDQMKAPSGMASAQTALQDSK